MAEIEKKKVSELPEGNNPFGFWMFGYKELANGAKQSVRVLFDSLLEVIYNIAANLQLERRLPMTLEKGEQRILFGEQTTIYALDVANISKFEISIDGEQTFEEIPIDGSEINFVIPAKTIATFRLTQQEIDTEMFIYLYAKAKTV